MASQNYFKGGGVSQDSASLEQKKSLRIFETCKLNIFETCKLNIYLCSQLLCQIIQSFSLWNYPGSLMLSFSAPKLSGPGIIKDLISQF